MIRKSLSVLLLGLITQQSVLYAQQESLLEKIWMETEKNYLGIQAAESAIESSQYNEEAVKSKALPQVKLQYQNTYGTLEGSSGGFFPQAGFFNVSGNRNTGSTLASSNFGSAIAEYEIYNFGRQKSEEKSAAEYTQKVITDKLSYLLRLKKLVSQRYLDFIFNESKLRWAKKNSARLAEIHSSSKALSRAGLKPEADSVLTYSSYVQALAMEDNWQGKKKASAEKIKEFYTDDFSTEEKPISSFLNPELNFPEGNSFNPSHPFLLSIHQESEYYLTKAEAERKASLPSLKVLGGYAYRGTGADSYGNVSGEWMDGFSNSANNVLVGIGLTWNISSLHTNRQKSNMLSKEAERLGYLEKQYQLSMETEIAAIQRKIEDQQKQLQKENIAVKGASDAYEMYFARYKSGLITLTELLQIRQILENAEKSQIDAAKEFWEQVVNKAELTGDFDFLFTHL
ncbi:MAG TPA: TolC family protein [Chryseobacterium sp.]|nr:TolC family protein [Chryseobacterium sp.]